MRCFDNQEVLGNYPLKIANMTTSLDSKNDRNTITRHRKSESDTYQLGLLQYDFPTRDVKLQSVSYIGKDTRQLMKDFNKKILYK